MQNALNPYMQGRQAGMARPYAQIQSGGKIGVDALMAARQANAITPTVTQGRNVQMVDIDPARDIRATADANRLDLRARMNNDATMDMESYRQQSQDARALTNNEFNAEQNALNRELSRKQLEAQLENNRILQDTRLLSEGKEKQLDREFQASESDKRIGANLEALGISNEHAKVMQGLDINSREKMTFEELNTRVDLANKEIALKEKEIQSRITMLEKELNVRVSEGDKSRASEKELQDARIASGEKEGAANRASAEKEGAANRATQVQINASKITSSEKINDANNQTQRDITTANNQNRLDVGKQSQLASLREVQENLKFKRDELQAMKDIKKAERDDKYAQSQAFGSTVARANEVWNKWQTQGREDYRAQRENAYMNKYGAQAIMEIEGGGDGSIKTESGVLRPTKPDRNGNEVMNEVWIERARSMILMDPTQRSRYSAEVDRAVDERDRANHRIWEAYQTTSAKAGIPTQSLTPLTPNPGGAPINPNKVY